VVEPIALPGMALVLVPDPAGLSTREVYEEADRIGTPRPVLEPDRLRELAGRPLPELASGLENDLEPAAHALRPEIGGRLRALRSQGALAALVTGSGPTAVGVFADEKAAGEAAAAVPGGLVTMLSR
jgi:4-diphosphocytidyl-2-C-methyl-D-erythritol kinase